MAFVIQKFLWVPLDKASFIITYIYLILSGILFSLAFKVSHYEGGLFYIYKSIFGATSFIEIILAGIILYALTKNDQVVMKTVVYGNFTMLGFYALIVLVNILLFILGYHYYNLIPLFIVGAVFVVLELLEALVIRSTYIKLDAQATEMSLPSAKPLDSQELQAVSITKAAELVTESSVQPTAPRDVQYQPHPQVHYPYTYNTNAQIYPSVPL